MRLLTHNTLRNNAANAKGGGFPLRITATEVFVDDTVTTAQNDDAVKQKEVRFVQGVLPMLDWPALTQAAKSMGLSTLPPTVTEDMVNDADFLRALYHVLMNVHLIKGMLTCPETGREFPVQDGIVDFMMEEEEFEKTRD